VAESLTYEEQAAFDAWVDEPKQIYRKLLLDQLAKIIAELQKLDSDY